MIRYIIQEKKDINILNIKEVNERVVISIFLEKQDATIYVEEHNRVIGIITLGNLRRHILERIDLINRNFFSVLPDTREEVEQIFSKSESIISVPFINEKGEIVEEYCRVKDRVDHHPISDEIISEIYKEVSVNNDEYSKVVVVIDGKRNYINSNIYREKVQVVDAQNIEALCMCLENDNVLVMDLAYSSFYLRKIFYDKYRINNIMRYGGSKNIFSSKHISERSKLFRNIAISRKSVFLSNIFGNRKIAKIDLEKCKWNQSEECYEYMERYDDEVEAIFSLVCFTRNSYIIINKRKVPIIADVYACRGALRVASMCDIALNIIPKLQDNLNKILLLRYPNKEFSVVKEYLSENISKRKRCEELKDSELSKFICVSEKSIEDEFISIGGEVIKNGYRQIGDHKGKYFNYVHGERYSAGNPSNYDNTIFLFGPCLIEGVFVTDENTIGSCIRKYISDKYYIKNMGRRFGVQNFIMRNETYKKGDIVVIMVSNDKMFEETGMQIHSVIDAYKKVDNLSEHVLDNLAHCDKEVTKQVADEIFSILEKEEVLSLDTNDTSDYPVLTFGSDDDKIDIPLEMQDWLTEVTKQKVSNVENAGAIVMNCNPFTLGHRYLIETASKVVDILYIFVLEEDKSFFKFKDRIELVRQGTKDLENVVVLPSGRYVISTETLPGYFDKEKNPYAEFDATDDLEIFSKVIAKEFGIKIRFAGEEPKDPFTGKYNEYMRNLLPKNGVQFVEIPRKQCGDKVISASLVRKYLKEKNFDAISKLVPKSTFEYLENNYK